MAETLCFRVSGEWLTDFSRQRVIEGDWDHAYRVLDSLEGMTLDYATKILKGDASLTGDSSDEDGIGLSTEEDTKWKKELQWHFGHVWKAGKDYYQPYAIVTSWGKEDLNASKDMVLTNHSSSRPLRNGTFGITNMEAGCRTLYYADDPKDDVVAHVKLPYDYYPEVARTREGEVDILLRRVNNFPHLILQAHSSADAAVKSFLESGRVLEERGWFQSHYDRAELASTDPEIVYDQHIEKEEPVVEETKTAKFFKDISHLMPDYDEEIRLDLFKKITEQAAGDYITLVVPDDSYEPGPDKEYSIPRAPFENWCLWRTDGAHLAKPWIKVSPRGLKMMGDDPYHTDFLIGAGLAPNSMYYDKALESAVYDLRFKTIQDMLNFKCDILCGQGIVYGKVVHPKIGDTIEEGSIIVIPNAGPKYLELALQAKAIITENGGAMAHLVTVLRGEEKVIARMPEARKKYPEGSMVTIDTSKGTIDLDEGEVKMMGIFGEIL